MPISELLSSPKRNRKHIKVRLLTAGLLENLCSACGVTAWRGNPHNMHLNHINGVRNDNRLRKLTNALP